jgi:ABC-type sugar transport system substrate-binding protein
VVSASLSPAPVLGRRSFLGLAVGLLASSSTSRAAPARRYRIGFANLTEDPGTRIAGLGFTAVDLRASFVLAAREYPVEMIFYDNDGGRDKALTNAEKAISGKLDLYVQYCDDPGANSEIAKRLKSAGIPVLALIYPVPGAPLYGPDNAVAGRLAGEALARFATATWTSRSAVVAIVGDLGNAHDQVPERAEAIAATLKQQLPSAAQTRLDSNGNPAQAEALMRRFIAAHGSDKLLVAALDDTTAMMAKIAAEGAGRTIDMAIVSQGCDRSVHGGVNDKKEIDPANRGSILIGSVAYLLDRYGYEVLPLAIKMLEGEALPPRISTRHVLVTATNVFSLYPPTDMN